jgi:hypothetical protein
LLLCVGPRVALFWDDPVALDAGDLGLRFGRGWVIDAEVWLRNRRPDHSTGLAYRLLIDVLSKLGKDLHKEDEIAPVHLGLGILSA